MIKLTDRHFARLEAAAASAESAAQEVRAVLAQLREPGPPWVDRVAEMPFNPWPDHPDMVKLKWTDWPHRELADIEGITIHHTMSHSPLATARHCTVTKGYPSIQYHLWVSQGDDCPVFLLAPLEWGMWHDHTGAYQKTVSVGMAGSLHRHKPPTEQLEATTRLVVYLMDLLDIPIGEVRGHTDRAPDKTVCPGWHINQWAHEFYKVLEATL